MEVSPAFTIVVTNQCDNPTSLISTPLDDQVYTLTGTSFTVVSPNFIANPDYCDIVYSVEVSDPVALTAFTFLSNTREFTFYKDGDLDGVSDSEKEYTVTLKASLGSGA